MNERQVYRQDNTLSAINQQLPISDVSSSSNPMNARISKVEEQMFDQGHASFGSLSANCIALSKVAGPALMRNPETEELGEILNSIRADQIRRIRATKDGPYTSFALQTDNKKLMVTLGVTDNATTITVSDVKGRIVAHVVQEGDNLSVYTPKGNVA